MWRLGIVEVAGRLDVVLVEVVVVVATVPRWVDTVDMVDMGCTMVVGMTDTMVEDTTGRMVPLAVVDTGCTMAVGMTDTMDMMELAVGTMMELGTSL